GHLEVNTFWAGVIALSAIVAAYSSEVWLAALGTIPRDQIEGGWALGLDRRRTFLLISWPQVLRAAWPGLGNMWMALLKETSLIWTLALVDLLRAASEASKNPQRPLLFYSIAGLIYLLFSILSGFVQARFERRANKGLA